MTTALEIYANQPSATVGSGGTDAPASGTVETWTVSSSASFPAASSSGAPPTQFHIADTADGYTSEVIAVTNVSGTTWTVTRGAESTTPVAHVSGFTVTQVVTAGALTALATASLLIPAPSGDATGATDVANIQAALNSGATGFIFRPGTYILDTDILPQSGQTLVCYGATFLRAAGSGTALNLISIAGTSTSLITDVKIVGGTWDGNKANVTNVTLYRYGENNGIRVAWAQNVSIESVLVQNNWGGGILSGDSVVSGLRVTNCLTRLNWDNGIFIRPGNVDVIVNGCRSHSQQYHGIDAIRSDLVTFSNCHSWGNGPSASGEGAGFRMEGCRWSNIEGCAAWDNGLLGGIALTDTSEGETGWTWEGAWSATTTYAPGEAVYWPPLQNTNEQTSWYCISAPPEGTSPEKGSAYWIPCAYDSLQGSPRPGYSIGIRDCRLTNNNIISTVGAWVSGGTYNINDSVWYYSGAAWSAYVCTTAVSGSSTPPPSDTGHWLVASSECVGITVGNQTDVEITGCTISGHASDGIYVGSGYSGSEGSDEVRVTGCDIRDNAGNGVNFAAKSAAKNFAVSDCRIYGNRNGVYMQAAAYLKVQNCQFTGNSNNGIETISTGAISVDIIDNVFTGTVAEARAWYEDGTNSTIRAAGNTISGQGTAPYYLQSPTSFLYGINLINGTAAPSVVALAFASSVTVNAVLGVDFRLTLTASTATLANPANPADGQQIRFQITQGSGGSYTLAYGSAYDFGAAGAPTLSTSAGKVDVLQFVYNAALSKWLYLGSALGN